MDHWVQLCAPRRPT